MQSPKVNPARGIGKVSEEGNECSAKYNLSHAFKELLSIDTFFKTYFKAHAHRKEKEKDDHAGEAPPKEVPLKVDLGKTKNFEIKGEVKNDHEIHGKSTSVVNQGKAGISFVGIL